jgi:hypothetical protein
MATTTEPRITPDVMLNVMLALAAYGERWERLADVAVQLGRIDLAAALVDVSLRIRDQGLTADSEAFRALTMERATISQGVMRPVVACLADASARRRNAAALSRSRRVARRTTRTV